MKGRHKALLRSTSLTTSEDCFSYHEEQDHKAMKKEKK